MKPDNGGYHLPPEHPLYIPEEELSQDPADARENAARAAVHAAEQEASLREMHSEKDCEDKDELLRTHAAARVHASRMRLVAASERKQRSSRTRCWCEGAEQVTSALEAFSLKRSGPEEAIATAIAQMLTAMASLPSNEARLHVASSLSVSLMQTATDPVGRTNNAAWRRAQAAAIGMEIALKTARLSDRDVERACGH